MNIDVFRQRFITGARAYLFYMQPVFPNQAIPTSPGGGTFVPGADLPTYLVRSTTMPGSTFDELTASWQGFDYKTAGKRTYDTWNVTFTVDVEAVIRNMFIGWQDLILNPQTNIHGMPGNSGYMVDQTVSMIRLDFNNDLLTYKLYGAYPSSVGEIALDYADSAYATFDVTYTFQYFKTGMNGVIP